MSKRHAPIEQLKKAGEEARRMLVERGIQMYENVVERVQKENPSLILPGIPTYLPHKWTIEISRNMLCDILEMWHAKHEIDPNIKENITAFIEFSIGHMNRLVEITAKKKNIMPILMKHLEDIPVLGKIFEPVKQLDALKSMRKFFVDSFAVSIIVNGQVHSTSDYIKWYLDWTDDMLKIWDKQNDNNNTTTQKKT